jgi:Na+/citrate or Na+/malate symporter
VPAEKAKVLNVLMPLLAIANLAAMLVTTSLARCSNAASLSTKAMLIRYRHRDKVCKTENEKPLHAMKSF